MKINNFKWTKEASLDPRPGTTRWLSEEGPSPKPNLNLDIHASVKIEVFNRPKEASVETRPWTMRLLCRRRPITEAESKHRHSYQREDRSFQSAEGSKPSDEKSYDIPKGRRKQFMVAITSEQKEQE
jgi:hypothetical protein